MRAILLDWMMEVCMEFMMKREIFYLSMNYVDRYLTMVHDVPKIDLQLVGVTSMYIAAKLEEVFPPRLEDFIKSTDGGYTRE